jgi:hypothetical protein
MCGMKPTWKRRVVKTLFLPFDPVLRDHGPCVRGAIIGSYSGACPRGAMIGSYWLKAALNTQSQKTNN